MIASARAAHVARTAGRLGIRTGEVRVDLETVVQRKDELVQASRDGHLRRLRAAGERLTLLRGHARFVGDRTIEVLDRGAFAAAAAGRPGGATGELARRAGGERHSAETVIIDCGARPAIPPIPGLDSVRWLDNRRAMELTRVPDHLVVLGAGYVGCEFAQMMGRFGARVTLLNRGDRLLGREDPEVSTAVEEIFRNEGIAVVHGARVERVRSALGEGTGGDVLVVLEDGRELRASHLLVATGRRPNTDDLGCDAAGVRLDPRGFIGTDDWYRTSAPGVYAVGDVAGEPQFTHVSWDDHRLLLGLLLGTSRRGRSGRLVPYVIYTDPQVARVGLSESDARAQGVAYEAATLPYTAVARAREVDETAGLLKVLIDPATERVLGATIVGAEAGELLHVFIALMQAGASARAIVDAQFVHPSFAEGVQSVVMAVPRFERPPAD